ncbi:uncharacterized protein LOC117174686 isoform X2 [Belonocnema kinseyi]|uniref:uncharacterized protein LOC117174686 isoform X2 n=1 Tax=Belonocnema kinseyi TaxID=2817044 RepID=UPI00143DD8E0|nr:uncharacterized protein LOC117174686 isoform X2 [Belonocnema kinseyi]
MKKMIDILFLILVVLPNPIELVFIDDSLRSKPDVPPIPLGIYGVRDPDGHILHLNGKIHDAIKQGDFIVGLLGRIKENDVLIPYENFWPR